MTLVDFLGPGSNIFPGMSGKESDWSEGQLLRNTNHIDRMLASKIPRYDLVGRGPTSASTGGRVSRVYKSCSHCTNSCSSNQIAAFQIFTWACLQQYVFTTPHDF